MKQALADKSKTDAEFFTLKAELDDLKDKLRFFNQNGDLDLSEINEALAMLRLKRDKGVSLEFLEKLGDFANVRTKFFSSNYPKCAYICIFAHPKRTNDFCWTYALSMPSVSKN